MGYDVPNEPEAFLREQAILFSTDLDALIAGIAGDAVETGCAVTWVSALTVNVAVGSVKIGGDSVPVTAGNLTATTADSNLIRIDIVVVDSAGVKSIVAGTWDNLNRPIMPAIPADSIILAALYIPPGATAISSNHIIDKRVVSYAIVGGMAQHGNEYHTPDFEEVGVAAGLITAHEEAEDPHPVYETSDEVDYKVQAHTSDAAAHHARYTDAETDARVATGIATHAADPSAHHVRYSDEEAAAVAAGLIATHTEDAEAHQALVTLHADLASNLLGITIQELDLNTQLANTVFAGPASGEAAKPAFRALVAGDVPDLSGSYEVAGSIATHAAIAAAHHAKYTDAEAVTAVATADDYLKNDANDTMVGDLTVNNLITAGLVDGRDVSTDGSKLDGIEAGADVTASHAPQAHHASHVNGSDDIQDATAGQKGLATAAQITKLDGIEALADVTDATNVNAAGATMNADTDVSGNGWVLDQDDMASDDATKVPTQQSVKAYVGAMGGYSDAEAIAAVEGEGTLNLTGVTSFAGDTNVKIYKSGADIFFKLDVDWGIIAAQDVDKLLIGKPILVDTIDELTVAAGVTIDGVTLKDDAVETDALRGLKESGGQALSMGAVADGEYLKRSGNNIVGDTPAGVGDVATDAIWDALGDLAVGTGADTAAVLSIGYSADFLRVNGSTCYWDSPGIADTNPVVIDGAGVADNDYAKFTANGLEGRSYAEVLGDLSGQASGAFSWNSQNLTSVGTIGCGEITSTGPIKLSSSSELRFYDNGNYVGFEAPALDADQIWVLPDADGDNGDVLTTNGAGTLSWSAGGGGGASTALDNLAAVAINTSLVSDTDSTDDLGSSSIYWANGYIDKVYLNSTATLDGATAGKVNLTGTLETSGVVGIESTPTATYMLNITPSGLTGTKYLINMTPTITLTANNQTVVGVYGSPSAYGASGATGQKICGLQFQAAAAAINVTSTFSEVMGVYAKPAVFSAGASGDLTATLMVGVYVALPSITEATGGSATITNYACFYGVNPNSSTIGTAYGVYCDDITGASTNYVAHLGNQFYIDGGGYAVANKTAGVFNINGTWYRLINNGGNAEFEAV